ncbi:putative glycosyltransferase [Glycine max]|nr:putative glycosyltransferase [Glycine max]
MLMEDLQVCPTYSKDLLQGNRRCRDKVLVSCRSLLAPNFSSSPWRGEPTSSLDTENKSASILHDDHEGEAPSPTAFDSDHHGPHREIFNKGDENDSKFKHKGTDKGYLTDHKYTKLGRIEARLAKARYSIREASKIRNLTSNLQDPDYVPQGSIYRNVNAFQRSYLEMEKVFKIFVYEEGEPPLFHNGLSKDIYATEGRFIHEMEKGRYYLGFMLVEYVYDRGSNYNLDPLGLVVKDYIQVIAHKHPFWNRSLGYDHFMLSCHDWGPLVSSYVDHFYNNAIRVLCNANVSEGFKPAKDVSFPEIKLIKGEVTNLVGGYPPSQRTILAFFAGHQHGYIR